jgi:hypothetical protein
VLSIKPIYTINYLPHRVHGYVVVGGGVGVAVGGGDDVGLWGVYVLG